MSAQRKISDPVMPTASDILAHTAKELSMETPATAADVAMSPALALQARLEAELQAVSDVSEKHPVLVAAAVFVMALAGTWCFGALLYSQI